MAQTTTVEHTTAARNVTRHEIQWGSVLKGAAIVTAVVVAGVVAYGFMAGPVTAFIYDTPMLAGLVEGVKAIAMGAFNLAVQGLSFVGGFLGDMFASILPQGVTNAAELAALGANSSPIAVPTAELAAQSAAAGTGKILGTAAVIGGGLLAAKPVMNMLGSTGSLVTTHSYKIPETTRQSVMQTPAHDVTNEVGSATNAPVASNQQIVESKQKNQSSAGGSQSWAERVPQADKRRVEPRQASYTSQAELEQAAAAAAQKTV